jgi:hypothetical protein
MTDELVAYLLDDLCPERREEVERRLATDADWQCEFQRLKECFATTNDPAKCVEEPPRDLVKRTCRCVQRADQDLSRSATAAAFVAAPTAGAGSSWSLADFTVAGGVLAVLSMLMLPALRESRDAARRIACQDNLRTLGTGLYRFQEDHGNWLPTIPQNAPAGLYAVALAEDVGFDRNELARLLVCPESELADKIARGEAVVYIPTYAELARLEGEERARVIRNMGGSYAYRVGYEDQNEYRQVKFTGGVEQPMLADAPRLSPMGVRSVNHDGCGQNVIYQQMCVKYRTNCDLATSLDPIFLNMLGRHAAGCGKDDIVMLKSDRSPLGPEPVAWVHPVSTEGDSGE